MNASRPQIKTGVQNVPSSTQNCQAAPGKPPLQPIPQLVQQLNKSSALMSTLKAPLEPMQIRSVMASAAPKAQHEPQEPWSRTSPMDGHWGHFWRESNSSGSSKLRHGGYREDGSGHCPRERPSVAWCNSVWLRVRNCDQPTNHRVKFQVLTFWSWIDQDSLTFQVVLMALMYSTILGLSGWMSLGTLSRSFSTCWAATRAKHKTAITAIDFMFTAKWFSSRKVKLVIIAQLKTTV